MIHVKDKITLDENLSSNEYLALLSIFLLVRRDEKNYYTTINTLSYLLTHKLPAENNFTKNLLEGFYGLVEKKIVDVDSTIEKNGWIINTKGVTHYSTTGSIEYYTTIDESDVAKILLSSKTYYTRSISLVRFYAYMLSTITKKGAKEGVGFLTQDDMSCHTGIHKKTIIKYIKTLEDLKLIYVYRPKDYIIFQSGEIVEIGNTYGEYKNKDKIITIGQEYAEAYGEKFKVKHKRLNKNLANKTRGYSHKFRHLKKRIEQGHDPEYTYDECKEIYLAMRDLNARYIKEGSNERLKDLSVFKSYDFYVEK